MSMEREETSSQLVIPQLHFMIVTAGGKERLQLVECHTSNGTCRMGGRNKRQSVAAHKSPRTLGSFLPPITGFSAKDAE